MDAGGLGCFIKPPWPRHSFEASCSWKCAVTPHQVEALVRAEFNTENGLSAQKAKLRVGTGNAKHEFDLYEAGKVIGGISTSPWFNKSGTNNTGGQDRAATELLWLSLWSGAEQRIHVLTDDDMAHRLFKRFSGATFPCRIQIQHFHRDQETFRIVGTL